MANWTSRPPGRAAKRPPTTSAPPPTRPTPAALAGVPLTHLHSLVRNRKVPRPVKDLSGDHWWSPADVEAVRRHVNITRLRRSAGRAMRRRREAEAAGK